MKADASRYLHILAFECASCHEPVLEWAFSPMRNLESVDASAFHPKCACGWGSPRLGAQARGHLVVPWSGGEISDDDKDINEEAEIERDTGNPV